MANNVFSLPRFGKYLGSDLRRAVAGYGISFCVMAALPLINDFLNNFFKFIFSGEMGGMPYAARLVIFAIATVAVLITFPAKCYGSITERNAGTAYSMIPASALEKTLSALLVCCVVLPLAFVACYGAVDALVCLLDPSCGKWLLNFSDMREALRSYFEKKGGMEGIEASIMSMANPFLYIDDFLQSVLIFLLGAICFKRGKVAKTFLTLIVLGMAVSMVASPIFMNIVREMGETYSDTEFFEHFRWFFEHIATIDTISDTVFNVALCVAIFFRIKTIKH